MDWRSKGGQRYSDAGRGYGAGQLYVADTGRAGEAGKFDYYGQQSDCLRQPDWQCAGDRGWFDRRHSGQSGRSLQERAVRECRRSLQERTARECGRSL